MIVGLGNPGPRYADTRHNIGFRVVDALAPGLGFREKFHGQFALGLVAGCRVGLLKPQTFMNVSGRSVRAAVDFYRVAVDSVLVVHDELDLPLGEVRLKVGGGEAGHNGLKSVTSSLGNKDYVRVRVGIGRPPGEFRGSVADFVLQGFAPDEAVHVPEIVKRAVEAIEQVLTAGLAAAMNQVNRRS